jgi:hypothetical protein
MLPRFEKPEDFREYLERNYGFDGNPYLSKLHMCMIAMMRRDKKLIDEFFEEFSEFFKRSLTDTEKELFLLALFDAMQLWAHELRKAREFRLALRLLTDPDNEYKHKLGEEYFFYSYYL